MIRLDDLRVMTALAHAAPGATLALATDVDHEVIVAHHHLDAVVDPCQLRGLVARARRGATVALLERIVDVRVAAGLEDLGGGIFRRLEGSAEQRWIPTLVPHDLVLDAVTSCPIDLPHDVLQVRVAVDTELATTTLCLSVSHGLWSWRLDELAVWAHSACLVAGLTAERIEWPAG